jgi:gamma-glutamyl phosphate reductase
MGIKIKDFVIQAKVNENRRKSDVVDSKMSSSSHLNVADTLAIKREIVDECLEKMNELLDKRNNRI